MRLERESICMEKELKSQVASKIMITGGIWLGLVMATKGMVANIIINAENNYYLHVTGKQAIG